MILVVGFMPSPPLPDFSYFIFLGGVILLAGYTTLDQPGLSEGV